MNYCKKCILPDTRPGIKINENEICSGCLGHLLKKKNRLEKKKKGIT